VRYTVGAGQEVFAYSFGVGHDISFDLEIISRFGCTVHAFDPTPRSTDWVRHQALPEGFQFHDYGLGNIDGLATFTPPADPTHVSYSMSAPGSTHGKDESFPVRRLQSIAADLRHDAIDLLKMDIEGAEYDALEDLLRSGPRIGQLLVEFHHRLLRKQVARTRDTIALLHEAGYLIFDVAPSGEEYSFVHEDTLTPISSTTYE
jgi:FkbM family methyltransferase